MRGLYTRFNGRPKGLHYIRCGGLHYIRCRSAGLTRAAYRNHGDAAGQRPVPPVGARHLAVNPTVGERFRDHAPAVNPHTKVRGIQGTLLSTDMTARG